MWVRSAKGHDIDASGLSYKAGDGYLAQAKGKSNQPVVFIDSTGRSYALDPVGLPSARGQGEPLTGKLTLPPGAVVEQVLMASDEQRLLMASDAGYGFVCTFNDLVARNRAGKALISLPENARVLPPVDIHNEDDMLLAITAAGRMLMFPVSDLPQLSKGKGNKIISIPAAEAAEGKDKLTWLKVLPPQSTVIIHVGKRKIKLRPEELQKVQAERERREAILRAEGEKKSAILRAEGQKESMVLQAEGDKEAAILRAEAKKEATIREAEGQAEAIRAIQKANAQGIESIKAAKADDAVIQLKSLEAFAKAADGKATKIIIPSEIQGMAGLVKSITEVAKDDEKNIADLIEEQVQDTVKEQ